MKARKFHIAIFLLPTLLLFLFVFAIPLVSMLKTSLFQSTGIKEPVFAGIQNYIQLFTQDRAFKQALINNIIWIVLQSTVHVAFGVAVALVLSRRPRGWKFVRTSFMIPNIISSAALGMLFLNILNPQIGVVNSLIRLFGVADFDQNWYGNSDTAFWAVTACWLLYAGVITLLIQAEISAIPEAMFEAAEMDGVSGWKRDWYITLPLLRNIIGTGVILAATSMIIQFDMIYMTTRGGPDVSTLNLALYYYKTANLENNYGVASAIGGVQVVLGIATVMVINRLFRIGQSDA